MKNLLPIIIFVLVTIVCIVGCRVYVLSHVTDGEKRKENQMRSALLVLDIQNDTMTIPQYTNKEIIIKNINTVVNASIDKKIPILYSKQEFSNPLDSLLSGGMYKKNSSGIDLYSQLNVASSNVFSKTKSDLFSNKEFESFLQLEKIGKLYIVGADASACVLKTSLAGMNRNYEITILNDCLFSINDMEKLKAIKKYKTNGIGIKDSASYLATIK